jgi:hypothetical protein
VREEDVGAKGKAYLDKEKVYSKKVKAHAEEEKEWHSEVKLLCEELDVEVKVHVNK